MHITVIVVVDNHASEEHVMDITTEEVAEAIDDSEEVAQELIDDYAQKLANEIATFITDGEGSDFIIEALLDEYENCYHSWNNK